MLSDPSVPEANRLPEPVLRDHIPLFLDSLTAVARTPHPEHFVVGEGVLPSAHARQRHAQAYSLRSALREWAHFRATLLDFIGDAHLTQWSELKRLLAEIDAAMVTVGSELYEADILSRIRIDADHDRTRSQLESLITTAPLGVAFVDQELRYLRVNETFARMSGLSVREIEARPVDEVTGTHAQIVPEKIQAVLDTGITQVSLPEDEGSEVEKPGWIASYYPMRNPIGKTYIVGIVVADARARRA
ncbi:MAG: PAS domain-containing protein [Polyangiaceae bacterium]|nr:PAS domain-containing protein [Polyangiaceae bacterium]